MTDECKLEDFLSFFPTTNTELANLTKVFDVSNFYDDILEFKEISNTEIHRVETDITSSQIFVPLKHQQFFSRILNGTSEDEHIIIDEMGTGKTFKYQHAIHQIFKNPDNGYKRAYFIVPARLERQTRDELMKIVPEYDHPNKHNVVEGVRTAFINRAIKDRYTIATHDKFIPSLKGYTDERLIAEFSNCIIVVDEVHTIRPQVDESTEGRYSQLHRLFHLAKNTKKIVLTGSPCQDTVNEIANLANLFLPLNSQMPTGKEFKKKFFPNPIDKNTGTVEMSHVEEFQRCFFGKITYLKRAIDSIEKRFIGVNNVDNRQFFHFRLCPSTMSEHQAKAYQKVAKDTSQKNVLPDDSKKSENSFYSAMKAASLFVFPDGTSGIENTKGYFTSEDDIPSLLENKLVKGGDTMSEIAKCSSKLAKVFEVRQNKEKVKALLYCDSVQGSGILAIAACLRALGYTQWTESQGKSAGKRFILVTGSGASKVSHRLMSKYLSIWSCPENDNAEIVEFFLGSEVISHGWSLFETPQVHIMTPHWNFTETDQAIARIFRLNSFKRSKRTYAEIYLHVSCLPSSYTNLMNIDAYIYSIAEIKDIYIQRVMRALLECNIGYHVTRKVNIQQTSIRDNSRDANYMAKDYSCAFSEVKDLSSYKNAGTIRTNYELMYADEELEEIREKIQQLFRTRYYVEWKDLKEKLSKHSTFLIMQALDKLIPTNVPFVNQMGFTSYLRSEGSTYYLTDNLVHDSCLDSTWYVENPYVKKRLTFDEALKIASGETLKNQLKRICGKFFDEEQTPLEIETFVKNLEVGQLSKFLEASYVRRHHLLDYVRQNYSERIKKEGNLLVNTLANPERFSKDGGKTWHYFSQMEKKMFEQSDKEKEAQIINNPTRWRLTIEQKTNTYRINNLALRMSKDGRAFVPLGRVLKTYDENNKIKICLDIDVEITDHFLDLWKKDPAMKGYQKILRDDQAYTEAMSYIAEISKFRDFFSTEASRKIGKSLPVIDEDDAAFSDEYNFIKYKVDRQTVANIWLIYNQRVTGSPNSRVLVDLIIYTLKKKGLVSIVDPEKIAKEKQSLKKSSKKKSS